jgi:biopolymer transport protein ExbB/TolQ
MGSSALSILPIVLRAAPFAAILILFALWRGEVGAGQELEAALEERDAVIGQLTEGLSRQRQAYEEQITARDNAHSELIGRQEASRLRAAQLEQEIERLKNEDETFAMCASMPVPDALIDELYGAEGSSGTNTDTNPGPP